MAKMLVLDTEFTNKGVDSEITELGYIIMNLKTNKIEKHISFIMYDAKVKPLTNRYYLSKYENIKHLINNKDIIVTTVKKAFRAFERDLKTVDIVAGYNLTSDLDIINLVADRLGYNSSVNNKQFIDVYFNAIWQLKNSKKYFYYCFDDKFNRISPEKRLRFTQDLVYNFLFDMRRKSNHIAYLDCRDTLYILAKLSQSGKIKKGLRSKMFYYNDCIK